MNERSKITSDALLRLAAKWRKEADELDDEARREPNRIARYCFMGAVSRIRKMAGELDKVTDDA
jgi:hypothetical protein